MNECPICDYKDCDELELVRHVAYKHLKFINSLGVRCVCWCGVACWPNMDLKLHFDTCGGLVAHYLDYALGVEKPIPF